MLFALLLGFGISAASPSACSPATVDTAIKATLTAQKANDRAAAKVAITPAAACPVKDGATYAAHVLRASIAVGEEDWVTGRAMLSGLKLHPEIGLGAEAAFLQLRIDQGLGDANAFTTDRAAMLAANDAGLREAGGRKRESFIVTGGMVAAYEASIHQGAFLRVYEFVATPDDPAAYPVTIQLTDDQQAASLQSLFAKSGDKAGPAHSWFIDLYTCNQHVTLAPPKAALGAQPEYDEIKARVVETFADPKLLTAGAPPEKVSCMAGRWILPGFGQTRKPD